MVPLLALLLSLTFNALWPIIGASGLKYYGSMPFMSGGLLIGLLLVSPWLLSQQRWKKLLDPTLRIRMMSIGILSGSAVSLYLYALNYTTPVNAVILAQIEVFYSTILSSKLLGEKLTLKQSLASLLVVAGTAIVALKDLKSPQWRGDLIILATPWMFQISHITSKKLPAELDAFVLTGGRIFYGFLFTLPFSIWALLHGSAWDWQSKALTVLFLQGLVASSSNFYLWYVAIRGMELSRATTILLSYPALTLLFSWILGLEHVRINQIVGLLCTFSGALWTARLALEHQSKLAVKGARL